jgi:hypothetical protein
MRRTISAALAIDRDSITSAYRSQGEIQIFRCKTQGTLVMVGELIYITFQVLTTHYEFERGSRMLSKDKNVHARRSFLRGAAGAIGAGLWGDQVLEALPQNVNTSSKPS